MLGKFTVAAAIAQNEAVNIAEPHMTQVIHMTDVVGSNVSLQTTMQNPATKRDPVNEKHPGRSLKDSESVSRGVQQTIADALGQLGTDIAGLHRNVILRMMQPGAMPDIMLPPTGKKPGRDTIAQMEVSRAATNATKQMATGNGVKRTNETFGVIAKNWYRQAGMVIYDTAGTIIQNAITHTIRGLKHLIRVADFDVIADTMTYHVNNFLAGVQKVVFMVAKEFTLSIGGKSKFVLMDKTEVVAMADAIATLTGKLEIIAAQQIHLASAVGFKIEATGTGEMIAGGAMTIGATGAMTLKGSVLNFEAAIINLGPGAPAIPPVVVPVPVPLPKPAIPEVDQGGTLQAPVAGSVNLGCTSAAGHLPKADSLGELRK